MATVTLATLRSTVQQRGSYENTITFTPAYLNGEINAALAELYELVADSNEGYYDSEASAVTVANQRHVDLPADFWRLRAVDRLESGTDEYVELRQVGIGERNSFVVSGTPVAYRVTTGGARGRIQLYPKPDIVYSLRLVYTPTLTALASDGATFEFFNGWEEYVICSALLRIDQREERPLGDRAADLERIKQRIVRGVTQRRAAEPEYLLPRARPDWTWWG